MLRRIPEQPLWLGPATSLRDEEALAEAGVEAVVDLALNEPPTSLAREMVVCRFPLVDGEGNPAWLLRAAVGAVAGLARDGVPTLVGCSDGMSLSVAVAGAAIALIRGVTPEEGLAIAACAGPSDVSPMLWRDVEAAIAGGAGAVRLRP